LKKLFIAIPWSGVVRTTGVRRRLIWCAHRCGAHVKMKFAFFEPQVGAEDRKTSHR
jgi:hypothetical protein